MASPTGQAQETIPLRFRDETSATAVRTGNNAAWLCRCARIAPLIGYSDESASTKEYTVVNCPECNRRYRVVAPSLKTVPTHVQELEPRPA